VGDTRSFRYLLLTVLAPLPIGFLAQGQARPQLIAIALIALFAWGMDRVHSRAHRTFAERVRAAALLELTSQELARQHAYLDTLLQSVPVAIAVIDRERRIRSLNRQFTVLFGYEANEAVGRPLVELVLDTELSGEQRRALELVRSSSEALLTILNDILDYSKIEAEHLELETIPFDLPKVVHATATLLAVRAREKHLELTVDVTPDVPHLVRGDPTRVRQVLMNLIGNAIKFTEQGEVAVSTVVARGDTDRASVRFRVRDTGIGISGDQLTTIFREFSQADASMTRRYGGTGLGLAISRKLVALMGGELTVASEVGRGSEFSFTLPFPIETPTAVAPRQAPAAERRRLP